MHRIIILAGIFFSLAAGYSQDFAGRWENTQGEFNSVHFSLRKDGRGVYWSRMDLTWKRDRTGLVLKMGESRILRFRYDRTEHTLTEIPEPDQDLSNTVYRKMSNEQTKLINPDIEGDDSGDEEDGLVDFSKPKTQTQTFRARARLVREIERQLISSESSLSFISVGKPAREFTVRKLGRSCSVELHLSAKAVKSPAPNVRKETAELTPEPDLPVFYSVSAAQVDGLRAWLKDNKIEFVELAQKTESAGRIETYEKQMFIKCQTDTKAALRVVEYLLTQMFQSAGKPYKIETMVRE